MTAARLPNRQDPARRPLVIGLVNNMAVAAMASTQAQFAWLLGATGRFTKLECFTMRKSQDGLRDYLPIEAIADRAIDAIIVTGMEVTTGNLRDEWIWHDFTRLYNWHEQKSVPAIWSCLAAHAAVLHRDGVTRQPLGAKLSGVFDCQRTSPLHRLTDGLPARWCCPHSRYNGLSAEALDARGYTVLSCGKAAGVDIFTRRDDATSFYFQGHPEYQAGTLLQEFLRDLRRYVTGQSTACPAVPTSYLDTIAEQEFAVLRKQAQAGHDVMEAARARAVHASFRRTWTDGAVRLYTNWLDIVAEHALRRSDWTMAVDAAPAPGAAPQ